MPNESIGILFFQNNKIFLAYALIWHNFTRYLHYRTQKLCIMEQLTHSNLCLLGSVLMTSYLSLKPCINGISPNKRNTLIGRLTVAYIKNFRRMMFLNPNMPFIWYQGGKDAHR